MKCDRFFATVIRHVSRTVLTICCVATILFGMQAVLPTKAAIAIPIDGDSAAVDRSSPTSRNLIDRVNTSLEDASYSADDRLKYRDESAGRSGTFERNVNAAGDQVKRKIGEAKGSLGSKAEQVKMDNKRTSRSVADKAERAADSVEGAVDNAVDSVRNFFD